MNSGTSVLSPIPTSDRPSPTAVKPVRRATAGVTCTPGQSIQSFHQAGNRPRTRR